MTSLSTAALDADAIAAHPLFPAVVAAYTDSLLTRRRGEALLNKILAQREREMLGFLLLCQHYAAQAGGKPSTLARLQQAELGSPRRVATFVSVLRLAGLVRSRRDGGDRRVHVLMPTERLIAHHREWTRAALRQLDRIAPHPIFERALDADPEFHRRACLAGAPEVFSGQAFAPGRFPLIDFLAPRRAGLLVAASLAHALCDAWHKTGTPSAAIALPYGRLARRLGVSRSHVLNLFRDAAARGFLVNDGAGEAILLSPRSRQDLCGYFAYELAFIARHALAALPGAAAR